GTVVDRAAAYDTGRLFLVSALALTTAGIAASLRANSAADIQRIFLDPIDKAHSAEMIGAILGIPFLGFALTIAIGSPLLDVIGGLLGVAMSAMGLGWQAKLAFIAVPGSLVAILCTGVKFPPTERAAAGVSMGQMFRELANPLFIVLFLSMFLTAASELAPGQ